MSLNPSYSTAFLIAVVVAVKHGHMMASMSLSGHPLHATLCESAYGCRLGGRTFIGLRSLRVPTAPRCMQGGDAVLSSPNPQVMARQASQQHSVRRPANPAAAAAGGQEPIPEAAADAAAPTAALADEQQVPVPPCIAEAGSVLGVA